MRNLFYLTIFSAIKYAINQIKTNLSFAANLAERLCAVAVNEYTPKAIVHLLSNISTDNGILLDGWIQAILALPAGLFYGTKIPCCAWIINRTAICDTVLFIDVRQLNILGDQDGKKASDLLCR